MFNINNLLNTPVQPNPWKHQIVSGFFDTVAIAKINTGMQALLASLNPNTTYDGATGISIYQAKAVIGQEAFDFISEANEAILDNISNIFAKYPDHRSYDSIMCVPSISIIAPNYASNIVRDSATDKVCNIVSYVTPTVDVETLLYSASNLANPSLSITNQYNTSMVSCPQKDVTWFKYSPVATRYATINFFVSKNAFDTMTIVNDNYQYTTSDGQVVDIQKDAASDATVADAQSGKLVRNLT